MTLVESRKYVCKYPLWLKRLTKKTTPRIQDEAMRDPETPNIRPPTKKTRRRYAESDSRQTIKIETTERCLLRSDEKFRSLFSPAMLRGADIPKMANGQSVCLRGHTTGRCFNTCRFKSSHGPLDSRLADSLLAFTQVMRNKRTDLATRTAGGNGEPSTQNSG